MLRRKHHPRFFTLRLTGFALAFLLAKFLLAAVLGAEPPQLGADSETPPPSALRVYVDPDTGELTSTPGRQQVDALSKSLESSLDRSSEGLKVFTLPFGGRGVFLAGRFQNALVARPLEGGGFALSCVEDHEHAAATLEEDGAPAGAAPVPAPALDWAER